MESYLQYTVVYLTSMTIASNFPFVRMELVCNIYNNTVADMSTFEVAKITLRFQIWSILGRTRKFTVEFGNH
jgi:hypothetical protein